jgi:hypothetical protein
VDTVGTIHWRTVTDSYSSASDFLRVTRSGSLPTAAVMTCSLDVQSTVSAWTLANVGFGSSGNLTGVSGVATVNGIVAITSANAQNANILRLYADPTQCIVEAYKGPTGTFSDLNFVTNQQIRWKMKTDGRFLVGLSSSDVTAGPNIITSGAFVAATGVSDANVLSLSVVAGQHAAIASNRTTTSVTFLPLAFFASNSQVMRLDGTITPTQLPMLLNLNGTLRRVGVATIGNQTNVLFLI